MATLSETQQFDPVYQLETTDVVVGGPGGTANVQPQQLVNRTAWLKQQLESLGPNLEAHVAVAASETVAGHILLAAISETLAGTNNTKSVTPKGLKSAIDAFHTFLVGVAPATLDQFNEIAAAFGNDPNFSTTIMNLLGLKAPLVSPPLSGIPTAPTAAPGTNTQQLATTAFVKIAIENISAIAIPSGTIIHIAKSTAPTGYLKANGALLSRTTYAALFGVIGTTFGVGDGSTTFALPDLRAEFIRGWDDARGVDAGRLMGSGQADMFASHTHTLSSNGAWIDGPGTYCANASGSVINMTRLPATGSTGGTETRPRNIALLACIKY